MPAIPWSEPSPPIPSEERALLTLAAAGQLLSVSPRTIQRLINIGDLRTVKVGRATRVHRAEVLRYAEALWATRYGPTPTAAEQPVRQERRGWDKL